jgi:hypothetical protein
MSQPGWRFLNVPVSWELTDLKPNVIRTGLVEGPATYLYVIESPEAHFIRNAPTDGIWWKVGK